eukprot:m.14597 g.14597  ORF g.14597 m.14597 type:complete len:258 (+) comp4851_c0_seq2:3466-4239(+)
MPKAKKTQVKQKTASTAQAAGSKFEKKPRNFGIGGDVQPKRDIGRFTKWPKYIRLQRQKAVLLKRLKVPPSINQFTNTLDKNTATELFRLLNKYRPETKAAKKERLREAAEAKAASGADADSAKPLVVKFGLNHITQLIEKKKATLVLIAHDVDPIELVVWLPALCRKMDIPYAIVKSKSRLGQVVHKKSATALAFTGVRPEDRGAFAKLTEAIHTNFNQRFDELRKRWGGGIMGGKTQAKLAQMARAKAREEAARR